MDASNIHFDPYDAIRIAVRLRGFLEAQGCRDVELGSLKRYTVGFSWITYGLHARWRDGEGSHDRALILRVGPPNGIFGPYRAEPEFVTLSALAGSAVPVPKVYWFDDSGTVLGAPFFIAALVEGEAPIPWTADGGPAFDEKTRQELGGQFIDALAALHSFDWRGKPVASIGGATDPRQTAETQIAFWERLMRQWSSRRHPMLEWALLWFRAHAPAASRVVIVHGDYRIGNFLEQEGRITAILDWELVHLGDPLEDLGWICLQAWRGRSPYMCHLFSREELCERYEARTVTSVDWTAWRYWEAFGTFKLAVMHLGAAYCFESRGFNDLRMAGMGAQLPRMLLQLEAALERAA